MRFLTFFVHLKTKHLFFQVVDFSEFREMMLSAEPNVLTNRQQSLAARSSRSKTSQSSIGSASGSRSHQLGFSPNTLQARQAAMPPVRLADTARPSSGLHRKRNGPLSSSQRLKLQSAFHVRRHPASESVDDIHAKRALFCVMETDRLRRSDCILMIQA